MYIKIFLNLILVLFLFSIQVSFIPALPIYFSNINIILIFLVYILIIRDLDTSLKYAIAFGLLIDIFSFQQFGSYLLGFIFSLVIINFLLVNFFTNRSLYAFFALVAFATILNLFFTTIINNILFEFTGVFKIIYNKEFFLSALRQLVLNSIFMIFIFYLTNFLSNSFRPVFLVNKKIK